MDDSNATDGRNRKSGLPRKGCATAIYGINVCGYHLAKGPAGL
jgi:hypothetical protein